MSAEAATPHSQERRRAQGGNREGGRRMEAPSGGTVGRILGPGQSSDLARGWMLLKTGPRQAALSQMKLQKWGKSLGEKKEKGRCCSLAESFFGTKY